MAALWARCTTNPDFLWTGEDDPNAIPFEDWIPELKWTDGMRDIATFARRMAEKILSRTITVKLPPKNHLPSRQARPIATGATTSQGLTAGRRSA
jgi:hypothetical protein